ncbi:MAG: HAMP domain-containing histidine kinase [Chroococcidiopsidaceae cyanobacterium CP_BM_ER_R8_30]|nr:HAMP domain-containing histidine kinase [Chroococcidiopsidaceae cyanobacterium CP_BM_ER_R8_30]
MLVQKWILPTLSEIFAMSESVPNDSLLDDGHDGSISFGRSINQESAGATSSNFLEQSQNLAERTKAERQWQAAIEASEQMLLQSFAPNMSPEATENLLPPQGLMLIGPMPVLSYGALSNISTWLFRADASDSSLGLQSQLPPATLNSEAVHSIAEVSSAARILPLLPNDPLADEQFCLLLTAKFSLVMVLGEDPTGVPAFLFSFEPEVVEQAWQSLRARTQLCSPQIPTDQLDSLFERYHPVAPDYRTVTQFSRLLLRYMPAEVRSLPHSTSASPRQDVELLQAFVHEVRTPLTTIRTLTRLLLKRRDLPNDVSKRIKVIDHECTEQIDRMELLFRAAELETSTEKQSLAQLTATSLSQILQQSIPRWQTSASRRNLTLDVTLPQQLPTVVSDPAWLDRVLTSLIENFTRSLPAGSHIQVQVIPAGDQLKLQLLSQSQFQESGTVGVSSAPPICKSIGPLLMFQPETGNISLNLAATKHLFQAIGGKLIVRQRPHQGEVLTIFLPCREMRRWGDEEMG